LFITAISKRGTSGSGLTVALSDGSSFFISKSFCEIYELDIDSDVGPELLEKLELESESIHALHKAGDLISRAEQSSGGLYMKLKKKGFSDAACNYALDMVISMELLDDRRFAELWISSRLRKHPEGQSMLYKGLLARGVKSVKAKEALANTLTEEDLLEAVMAAGNKISGKYKDSKLKLQQALYRRGFTNREINYFLDNSEV